MCFLYLYMYPVLISLLIDTQNCISNVPYFTRLVFISMFYWIIKHNKLLGYISFRSNCVFFGCGTGNNSKLPCASANYIKPNLRATRSRGFIPSTEINNVRRGNFAWTMSAIISGCINFWNWQNLQIFRRNIRLSCGEHNWIFTVNCK